MTAAEFKRWLQTARPEETAVYFIGELGRERVRRAGQASYADLSGADAALEAAEAGFVHLKQAAVGLVLSRTGAPVKPEVRSWQYIAERRAPVTR